MAKGAEGVEAAPADAIVKVPSGCGGAPCGTACDAGCWAGGHTKVGHVCFAGLAVLFRRRCAAAEFFSVGRAGLPLIFVRPCAAADFVSVGCAGLPLIFVSPRRSLSRLLSYTHRPVIGVWRVILGCAEVGLEDLDLEDLDLES